MRALAGQARAAAFHNPQVGAFPFDQAISFGDFEGLNNNNTDNEVGTTFNCAGFVSSVPIPVSTVSPPRGFGIISSTVNFNNNNDSFAPDNVGSGTPRQVQFGLKLIF